MEDLRLAIIVIGVFCILGILVHGLWTIRKNAVEKSKQKARKEPGISHAEAEKSSGDFEEPLTSEPSLYEEGEQKEPEISDFSISPDLIKDELNTDFDEDGIGQVRTVSRSEVPPMSPPQEEESQSVEEIEEEVIPEPPSSLLKAGNDDVHAPINVNSPIESTSSPKSEPVLERKHAAEKEEPLKESFADKAKKLVSGDKKERPVTSRVEPKIGAEDQIRMDFEQQPSMKVEAKVQSPSTEKQEDIQEEVLALNVKMPDGKAIPGAALLPALLTLGFKFGEHNVFHRHAASNGKGPKLFSLANMFKPGTFDVDAMETFETQGITLFMILPIEGEPQQVFNMMHNAARKLADEFGGQILDGRRSLLTKQSLQQYVEKIREFERRRMINRS